MNSRVKFAEPLRRRRQLLLRVQRMLLRRGSKAEMSKKHHSLHEHDKNSSCRRSSGNLRSRHRQPPLPCESTFTLLHDVRDALNTKTTRTHAVERTRIPHKQTESNKSTHDEAADAED